MAKIRKQIISPHVRFAASSRGPYANKLGGGMYAKSFGLRERGAAFVGFSAGNDGVIRALKTGVGGVTFTTAAGKSVTTGPDGLVETAKANEIRYENGRREENLCDNLVTETVTVTNTSEYQLTIAGDSGATAVCSGAFTGTLTADGANRISWPNGVPKTAAGTSVTITVTGNLTEKLLQEVTGRTNKAPSEYIPEGEADGTVFSHAGSVRYFSEANATTVDGAGVVTEAKGSAITDYRALFESGDDAYPIFDYANFNQSAGTWYVTIYDYITAASGSRSIMTVRNAAASVMLFNANNFRTNDGANLDAPKFLSASAGQTLSGVVAFETGGDIEISIRSITISDPHNWATRAYSGAFIDDNVFGIARGVLTPLRLRDLTGYHEKKDRDWIEENT